MLKLFYSSIIFCFLFATNINFASAQYTEDFRAKTVLEKTYTDVKGSPYLLDNWSLGIVKMASGSSYKDMSLKYDQVTGELIFQDKSGKSLGFADPIAEFKIIGNNNAFRIFRSGFKATDNNSDKYFYEVLYDGGTILLKDPKKNIVEHRAYNSSTAVKSIVETPAYYVVVNGQLIKFKKDKKALLAALPNSDKLESYIQDNKLNVKDDTDLAKVVLYYDSIK
ncbi:hypothetical protein [Daejeonella lutea]|uniref:Uncharacterized protein n=1 Tax=Daejeonella lutea TaxID=572036 RepID=A0A1T5CV72_9SPHI|nr:hypothetical protein [Daejeonella lutea]SKB63267.1 hypothetical protein SAMN05661099_1906 [Daejeonella lutea]